MLFTSVHNKSFCAFEGATYPFWKGSQPNTSTILGMPRKTFRRQPSVLSESTIQNQWWTTQRPAASILNGWSRFIGSFPATEDWVWTLPHNMQPIYWTCVCTCVVFVNENDLSITKISINGMMLFCLPGACGINWKRICMIYKLCSVGIMLQAFWQQFL